MMHVMVNGYLSLASASHAEPMHGSDPDMTVEPIARPELPEPEHGAAYDWDVSAHIGGKKTQRAVGRTDDYGRACQRVEEALKDIPEGLAATGGISTAFPFGYLPGWEVASACRDASGGIEWTIR